VSRDPQIPALVWLLRLAKRGPNRPAGRGRRFPLTEQLRIVKRLEPVQERIQTLKHSQQESEARLEELERSILDKAFRGEL